jgi:hypothetical protein
MLSGSWGHPIRREGVAHAGFVGGGSTDGVFHVPAEPACGLTQITITPPILKQLP